MGENMTSAKQPHLTRLEYLTRTGWVLGHSGVGLLSPKGYVERLGARGKFGRAIVLDTGEVFETPGWEEAQASLRPPTDGSNAHVIGESTAKPVHIIPPPCDLCSRTDHAFAGECLL